MIRFKTLACLGTAALLGACGTLSPPETVDAKAPPQWYAPLPHDGKLTDLTQWWKQQGDPLLSQLIDAAQAASPSIASAGTRIAQARATRVAAGASLLPKFDATYSATRSSGQPPFIPTNTSTQAGLQASWELDVFGGARASWSAARSRYEGARAGWHDARVSVAAETANQYYELRACEKLLELAQADAKSRSETAHLSDLSEKAGFTASAVAALARASAAEGRGRATQQQAQCDIDVKALVALTAIPEPELRQKLAAERGDLPQWNAIAVERVPAKVLEQRPDVFAAEMEVAAASADVGNARAQRFPQLGLSGFIGRLNFSAMGSSASFDTWSVGPLQVTLPIFDGGRRSANVDAAIARYDEAAMQYRAKTRQAVREVEQALVTLHSTGARADDAQRAVDGYRASYAGTESRYKTGLASLVELEDARRNLLVAEITLVGLQRDRVTAWVALYRALGGGWSREDAAAQAKQ